MNFLKAIIGLLLIFIYHAPAIIYRLLLVSYYYVFNGNVGLTADPKEHLRRAKKILKQNKNSLLLYAAIEVRFALERMLQRELIFYENVSNKILKEYDPVKKKKYMSKVDEFSDLPHKIYLIDKKTGRKIEFGKYKPMDKNKINNIKGKLGDILHPTEGLYLGISDDPWYKDTRTFLNDAISYLSDILKDNESYFFYKNLNQFEMKVLEE